MGYVYHLEYDPVLAVNMFPSEGAGRSVNVPVPGQNKSLTRREFRSNNHPSDNACPWIELGRFIAVHPLTIMEAFRGHSL